MICDIGPSSAQSSTTYAKVSDLTTDQSTAAAPIEPSVDDLAPLTNDGTLLALDVCLCVLVSVCFIHLLITKTIFIYLSVYLIKSYHSLIALILPAIFMCSVIFCTQLFLLNKSEALNGLLCHVLMSH